MTTSAAKQSFFARLALGFGFLSAGASHGEYLLSITNEKLSRLCVGGCCHEKRRAEKFLAVREKRRLWW
jgi:hypothetical protein